MEYIDTKLFKIREETNIKLIGLIKNLEIENTQLRKQLNKIIAHQKRNEAQKEYRATKKGRIRWKK